MMGRIGFVLSIVFLCAMYTTPVSARFHLMRINEVLTHAGGDSRIQYVELQMEDDLQDLVGGHDVRFYNAAGELTGTFVIPGDVSSANENDTILIGTQAFADSSDVAPDFILPEGLIPVFSGRVCFENIDCVAYGDFTGDNGFYGNPAPRVPILGVESLTRVRKENPVDNSTDYALAAPTPQKNGGSEGTVNATDPEVFLSDDFADLSNWDVPTPNGGLSLENCDGPPPDVFVPNTGTVELGQGSLILTPGATDDVGLGDTLVLTGLKTEVAVDFSEENYRVKFNFVATEWVEDFAVFLRAHYLFDSAAALIDPVGFSGAGANWEVELPTGEQRIADIFPDGRGVCIFVEIPEDQGPGSVELNRFLDGASVVPGTVYTAILDVDGDDQVGPLTVQAKIFPADQDEPTGHVASWKWSNGLGEAIGDEDHGISIAVLGDTNRPAEADLPQGEISELTISAIPRNQQTVAALTCQEELGDLRVFWCNPSVADTTQDINIFVNGVLDQSVPGDATEAFVEIPAEPTENLTIEVVNYSGAGQVCHYCLVNSPPNIVIDGPTELDVDPGFALMMDSSLSNDGEGSFDDLDRVWEVLDSPDGAVFSFDDPGAATVVFSTDTEGDYTFRLTITDRGCNADPNPQQNSEDIDATISTGSVLLPGDLNYDGGLDISDPIKGLNFLFASDRLTACYVVPDSDPVMLTPVGLATANWNGDDKFDISDSVATLNFQFGGAAAGGRPHFLGEGCSTLPAGCVEKCNP